MNKETLKRIAGPKMVARIKKILKIYRRYFCRKKSMDIPYDERILQKEKENNLFESPQVILDIEKLNIAFIIPNLLNGSGGHRNFFRAIKYLHDFGHQLTVYYTQTDEHPFHFKKRACEYFYDVSDILFIKYDGRMGFHDVCFATWWETAYLLRKHMDKIRYPFYFVQDFEPSFTPMGDAYILGENSYKLGYTHICSGKWCSDFLKNKYNVEADFFKFPLDRNIYHTGYDRTDYTKNIIFFAKPEMPRRCFGIGIQALKKFHELQPEVEIRLFGSANIYDDVFDFSYKKLGLLPTLKDLAQLYANADLGLVFSTTNPSLVPYEMMACGCPVADMNYNDATLKYGDVKNVFLLDIDPDKMGQQLALFFDNKKLLSQKREYGINFVSKNFPSEIEMAKKIEALIKQKIITGKIGEDNNKKNQDCCKSNFSFFDENTKKCPICNNGKVIFTEKRYNSRENKIYDISVCNNCLTAIKEKGISEEEYQGLVYESFLAEEEMIKKNISNFQQLFEYFKPYYGGLEGKNILDFATGSGYMAISSAEEGASNIYALDLNTNYIKNTLSKYPIQKKIHILTKLDDIKSKIDIVFLWHILEHIEDPYMLLKNIKTYCTDNVILLIQTPQYDDFYIEHMHVYLFNSHSLKILLKRVGFDVVHSEYDHTNRFITTIAKLKSKN